MPRVGHSALRWPLWLLCLAVGASAQGRGGPAAPREPSSLGFYLLASAAVPLVLSAGFGVLLYAYQDRLLYHPKPPGHPANTAENPPGMRHPGEQFYRDAAGEKQPIPYERHRIVGSDGEKIDAFLMLHPEVPGGKSKPRVTLIYFHGNAGNVGFRFPNAAVLFRLGLNILLMDYRGYGDSTGQPSEAGIMTDAEAVLEFALVHPVVSRGKIALFGRSLGGAVALALAHRRPRDVCAVVAENTFTSIADMVDAVLPVLAPFKAFILRLRWDVVGLMPTMTTPALFISGDSDELVPPPQPRRLYDTCASRTKLLHSVSGGGHNDLPVVGGERYYEAIASFIKTATNDDDGFLHVHEEDARPDDQPRIPTMTSSFQIK